MEHSALPIFAKDGLHETSIVPKHIENITNKANQKDGNKKIKPIRIKIWFGFNPAAVSAIISLSS